MGDRVPDDIFASEWAHMSEGAAGNESVRPSDMASFVPREADADGSGAGGVDADADADDALPCDPMTAPLPDDRSIAALELVRRYACAHLDKTDGPADFEVYVVWKCFVLGHCKWLISTTLRDGMYYEVTYNSARMEYYLDAYKKFENLCIAAERRHA